MKKIILVFFVAQIFLSVVKAQSIVSDSDWTTIIGYLENEDWVNANQLTKSFLQKIPKAEINSDEAANLRYMYLLSESGLMNMQKVTHEQAYDHVKDFVGLNLILPGHPIILKNGFSSIQMLNNKTDTLFVTAANKAGTEIFCFEYIIMDTPLSIDEFKNSAGKICRVQGRLKSIRVDGHMLPRFRMIIDKAAASIQ